MDDPLAGPIGLGVLFVLVIVAVIVSSLFLLSCRHVCSKRDCSWNSHHPGYRVVDGIDYDSFRTEHDRVQPDYSNSVELRFVPKTKIKTHDNDCNKKRRILFSSTDDDALDGEIPLGEIPFRDSDVDTLEGEDIYLSDDSFIGKDDIDDNVSEGFRISQIPYHVEKFITYTRNKVHSLSKRFAKPDTEVSPPKRLVTPKIGTSIRPGVRIQRPDSVVYTGLGLLTFTLNYDRAQENLVIHLISGRRIVNQDGNLVSFPSVVIEIENRENDEVVSHPDDSPNPEYDQEFEFYLPSGEVLGTFLRLIVFDMISQNEKLIVGFIRVPLSNFHSTLLNGDPFNDGTGPVCREIKPYLSKPDMESGCEQVGEILTSLFYNSTKDEIHIAVLHGKNLRILPEDTSLYIKVSLLLDDFVILTKKSADVDCSTSDPVFNSTFVFNALSSAHTGVHLSTPNVAIETNDPPLRRQLAATISDLSRLQEGPINDGCLSESPPSPGPMRFASDPFGLADSTNELSSVFPRQLRELSKSDTKAASSRLFYNNMGALISVRTKTSYGMKRVLGRVFVGKTQFSTEDGLLHWAMMTKNHREFIHKTHLLSLDM